MLDWRRYPAGELVRLYHERREIEVAYLALRHTLLGGYVLRSRDRPGAEQELWALLTVYQALRMAMTAATGTVPGTDPDRASFTAALEAAREQVITARGIEDSGSPADIGRVGRAVLAGLLPARRARYSARKVKCSTPRWHVRDQDRPGPRHTDHPGAGHHHGPATGPARRPAPQPEGPAARSPPAPARHQKRPGHPHHGQPARTRLGRT